MIRPGLASVSFRKLPARRILELLTETAELKAIEWGGDVHVPPGALQLARELRLMAADLEIESVSYGSYYRAGETGNSSFQAVIDTALELGAANIRIWAGNKASAGADKSDRRRVIEDVLKIAAAARQNGLAISFEYHGGTLADSGGAVERLLTEINCENVFSYWQPRLELSPEENCRELRHLAGMNKLTNIHVYHWEKTAGSFEQLPLVNGFAEWTEYFNIIARSPITRYALLEFIRHDSAEQFLEDAGVLAEILKQSG